MTPEERAASSAAYRTCAEMAEAEYRELVPVVNQMIQRINRLRAVINACSELVGREVDEEFKWASTKEDFRFGGRRQPSRQIVATEQRRQERKEQDHNVAVLRKP